jgi:hypothetical protein
MRDILSFRLSARRPCSLIFYHQLSSPLISAREGKMNGGHTDRYNCIAAYVGSSTFSGLTTVGAGAAVDDDASAIVDRYMIE